MMGSSKATRRKSRKKRRRLAVAAITSLIVVTLVMVGGFVYTLYLLGLVNFVNTENESFGSVTDIDESEAIDPSVAGIVPDDPITINDLAESVDDIAVQGNTKVITNILLLGVETDRKDNYIGRSDTNIIVSINKHTKTIKLISLLRDTYVSIPGRERNKLNAAFRFGGFSLLQQTIEENYRLKIDRFVAVNFSAFSSIVDAMGGVDIELTEREAEIVKVGNVAKSYHLNGKKALDYVRIRKIGDDWGRTSRQRTLLKALMKKAKNMDRLTMMGTLDKVLSKASTNMKRTEFLGYIMNAPSYLGYEIKEFHVPERSKCNTPRVPIPGTTYVMEVVELKDSKAAILELHHEIYG